MREPIKAMPVIRTAPFAACSPDGIGANGIWDTIKSIGSTVGKAVGGYACSKCDSLNGFAKTACQTACSLVG